MKKMNNKGFLLAESLVVSTFVLTVLILLFVQFKTLFSSYEDSYDYNTVEGIYNLNTMKKYINSNEQTPLKDQMTNNYVVIVQGGNCVNNTLTDSKYCKELVNLMGLTTLIYTKSDIVLDSDNDIFAQQTFKNFIDRIKTETNKKRLIGQFKDGTYATIVYGSWEEGK